MTGLLRTLVVDTSAIIACCMSEPGYQAYEEELNNADRLVMSAVTHLELRMVASTYNVSRRAQEMLDAYEVEIAAFDEALSQVALTGFERFGKGRHPAGLNFGDCCAYALAKSLNLPLLYKGNDFARTDIQSALA